MPKAESLRIDPLSLGALRWESSLAPAHGGDYGSLDSRAKNVPLLQDTPLQRSPQQYRVAFGIAEGGTQDNV